VVVAPASLSSTSNGDRNDQHTLTRKFVELVQAVKMSQQQSKDQIMEAYLNTVYYGRGAYGIQAAAKAFFNKNVEDLTASEAAFLAGCINVPALNDDVTHTTERWTYVMGRMDAHGWLSATDKAKYTTPPKAIEDKSGDDTATPGPLQFIERQVLQEAQDHDLDRSALQRWARRSTPPSTRTPKSRRKTRSTP